MKLGFIGIGLMGRPMTLRLLAANHEVTVWNRSRDKLAPVLEKGARAAASPAEVARAAEIVMMCVTDQHAAREVLFANDGIVAGGSRGKLVVDFSSIAPASAREFAARLEETGMGLVDAPVSGGVAALRLAETAGVDTTLLPEALKGGFADSLPLQIFGSRMASRTFEPSLGSSAIMLKDLENAAAVARENKVPLPMASTAVTLYRLLAAQGKGEDEISRLIELLEGKRP